VVSANGTALANTRVDKGCLSRNETVNADWRNQRNILTPDRADAARRRLTGPTPRGEEHAAGSRALVALAPAAALHKVPESYRQAPFLAQLLAMKDQHPQTRERRRAEPDEALAAYRATAALTRFQ